MALLAGCISGTGPGFGSGERSEDEVTPPVAVDTTPLCPTGACNNDECSVADSVEWEADPGGAQPCLLPGTCDLDYLRFLDLASDEGEPISLQELRDSITALAAGDVEYQTDPIANEALREVIIEATNLGFLLDGLDERPLTVREVGE